MIWLQKLRLRLRALSHKEKLDAQMNDEMRSHIEMQTQEKIEARMNPERRVALAAAVRLDGVHQGHVSRSARRSVGLRISTSV